MYVHTKNQEYFVASFRFVCMATEKQNIRLFTPRKIISVTTSLCCCDKKHSVYISLSVYVFVSIFVNNYGKTLIYRQHYLLLLKIIFLVTSFILHRVYEKKKKKCLPMFPNFFRYLPLNMKTIRNIKKLLETFIKKLQEQATSTQCSCVCCFRCRHRISYLKRKTQTELDQYSTSYFSNVQGLN